MPRNPKTILLQGFDPNGEPEIRLQKKGELHLVFNFMPPSDVQDAEAQLEYDDFDKQLAAGTGLPVLWEDRETFIFNKVDANAAEKIKEYVEGYRFGKHIRFIKIIKTPPGEAAPESIRAAWVGLVLPLSPVAHPNPRSYLFQPGAIAETAAGPQRMTGYAVEVLPALAVLERSQPAAAAWWRANAPQLMQHRKLWIYDANCCELVP